MKNYLTFIKSDGFLFLQIFRHILINRGNVDTMLFEKVRSFEVEKSPTSWFPYIRFVNIIWKEKAFGVSQAMLDKFEVIDIIPVENSKPFEIIEGDYVIKGRTAIATEYYPFIGKKKEVPVYQLICITYKGETILKSLTHIHHFSKSGQVVNLVSVIDDLNHIVSDISSET